LLVEVLLVTALFGAAIWWIIPPRPSLVRWWHLLAGACIGAVPILLNVRRGDSARDAGLRLDTLAPSASAVSRATVLMAAAAVAAGFVGGGFQPVRPSRLVSLCATYAGWGLAQQYLLQAFLLRRLRLTGLTDAAAVVVAACLFGCLHAPNWWLVAATAAAGLVWCRLFVRCPNLVTLSVSHAVLAVLLYWAWPWTKGLTVGPGYLARLGQ